MSSIPWYVDALQDPVILVRDKDDAIVARLEGPHAGKDALTICATVNATGEVSRKSVAA